MVDALLAIPDVVIQATLMLGVFAAIGFGAKQGGWWN